MSDITSSERSRGRSRGLIDTSLTTDSMSNVGRGRGPGGGRGAQSSLGEAADPAVGRGVRRGMERGRAIFQTSNELAERFKTLNFEKAEEPYSIASKSLFPESVLTDYRIVRDPENVQVSDTHGIVGKAGRPIKLQTNILFLQHRPGWNLYSYRVDFKPEPEDHRAKKFLIKQHADVFGGASLYIFDGTKLFTQTPIDDGAETIKLDADLKSGDNVRFRLKFLQQHDENDPIALQLYNLHFKHYQGFMEMQEIRKNFYFPSLSRGVTSKGHKFQIWPGLIASINLFQRSVKDPESGDGGEVFRDLPALLLDTSSKVVRQETIYDAIRLINKSSKGGDFQKEVKRQLVGSTVLTKYSTDYYRIDDVDFKTNPMSTFDKNGTEITYIDYMSTRYQLKVKDPKQPMVICKPKKGGKGKPGQSNQCLLIPEFLLPTGLTDAMRTDFTIMRELATETRRTPHQRYMEYKRIHELITKNESITTMTKNWGLRFKKQGFETTMGHVLKPIDIVMNKRGARFVAKGSDKADWDRELKGAELFKSPPSLKRWVFLGSQKSEKVCAEFAKALKDCANKQGWKVGDAKMTLLSQDKEFTSKAKDFIEKKS